MSVTRPQLEMGTPLETRETCLLCGARDLELALPMAPTPLAGAYYTEDRLPERELLYPLDLYLCGTCGHLQMPTVVDPEVLFRDYQYVTSSSPGLPEHFGRYADEVASRIGATDGRLVVEIGSNDGTLLQHFANHGFTVLGVDPGVENARTATAAGLETLPEFFDAALGARLREERGPASVVAANNVFAHLPDIAGVADGIRALLAPDGFFVFEVSYLIDILDKMLFDTVYHEHLSFHAVEPLQLFFARHGLELFDVQRVPTKGGSIRGFAQLAGGPRAVEPIVGELVALERERGLERLDVYREYAERIGRAKQELLDLLRGWKDAGETVAGFGASHTVTTLMFQFGLDPSVIDFLVDENPAKQGTFSPGHRIPVLPPSALAERDAHAVVLLAWQYAPRMIERTAWFGERGGRFVIPLPQLTVV